MEALPVITSIQNWTRRAVGTRRRLTFLCAMLLVLAAAQIFLSAQLLQIAQMDPPLHSIHMWGLFGIQCVLALATSVTIPIHALVALHAVLREDRRRDQETGTENGSRGKVKRDGAN